MIVNMKIANIMFYLSLDCEIEHYLRMRVPDLEKGTPPVFDVCIICEKKERLNFCNDKFLHQQEPDISEQCFYREILDLGIFGYDREAKLLNVLYMNTDRYPYNSFEVVVDTILQFMYLITLDFNIVPLHASVLSYYDKAILIFGNSGSGKTTLELSLLNSGFRYFSDDIAFLDKEGLLHNSGERIIACTMNTVKIVQQNFVTDLFVNSCSRVNEGSITGKNIIHVSPTMMSAYSSLTPILIIFPAISDIESLERLTTKNAFLELIQLSVSKQFSSVQKELYMKRLRELCEAACAYKYNRINNTSNKLSEICAKIWEISRVQ